MFECARGKPQSLPPRRHLHSFEIQILDGLLA
jgi:hypothetical protein